MYYLFLSSITLAARLLLPDDDAAISFGVNEEVVLSRSTEGVLHLNSDLIFFEEGNPGNPLSLSVLAVDISTLKETLKTSVVYVPSMEATLDVSKLQIYLETKRSSTDVSVFVVGYNHTLVTRPVNGAYLGGVYSPSNNRIYFVPYGQANETGDNWHYIDCRTGLVVEYIHTLGPKRPVYAAYGGGVYSPSNNRVYFVPSYQAQEICWHYIDCSTGLVVGYNHTLGQKRPVNGAYFGGVYSPSNNRIYFVPFAQAGQTGDNWHYIDCSTGSVVEYIHTLGPNRPVDGAYQGGAYSPSNNRIYFVPYGQAGQTGDNWHYIDCNTGLVVEYIHTLGLNRPVDGAYLGGVFSPSNNRIYFVPFYQANENGDNWHYIDCNTGLVVEYIHTLGPNRPVDGAYQGGVYSPSNNRIYFVPYGQAGQTGDNWHYIDCNTGLVVEYIHTLGLNRPVDGAYLGGVYSPSNNRVFFVPYGQADEDGTNWHFIADSVGVQYPPTLFAGTLFNKF